MRTYTLTLDIPETIDPDEASALCRDAIRNAIGHPETAQDAPVADWECCVHPLRNVASNTLSAILCVHGNKLRKANT